MNPTQCMQTKCEKKINGKSGENRIYHAKKNGLKNYWLLAVLTVLIYRRCRRWLYCRLQYLICSLFFFAPFDFFISFFSVFPALFFLLKFRICLHKNAFA